jgi:hypothetical protein
MEPEISNEGTTKEVKVQRTGFLAGQMAVPDDFDQMGRAEIERLFEGTSGG